MAHNYNTSPNSYRILPVDGEYVKFEFYDTCGSEGRRQSMIPSIMRNTELCFLVYSMQKPNTHYALEHWMNLIKDNCSTNMTTFVCIGNNFGEQIQIMDDIAQIRNYINMAPDKDFDQILVESARECIRATHYRQIQDQKKGLQLIENQAKGCC